MFLISILIAGVINNMVEKQRGLNFKKFNRLLTEDEAQERFGKWLKVFRSTDVRTSVAFSKPYC